MLKAKKKCNKNFREMNLAAGVASLKVFCCALELEENGFVSDLNRSWAGFVEPNKVPGFTFAGLPNKLPEPMSGIGGIPKSLVPRKRNIDELKQVA